MDDQEIERKKKKKESHGRAGNRYSYWVWDVWDTLSKPGDSHADTQNGQKQQEAPCAAMAMKTMFSTRTFGLKNHPTQTEDAAAEISIIQREKSNVWKDQTSQTTYLAEKPL